MPIWQAEKTPTPEQLNGLHGATMVSHLGIEFTEVGEDYLRARMPVDERTQQPFGLLHGGASVALAETMGSVAGNLCLEGMQRVCVGQEINANHVRPVRSGWVYGECRALHLGASSQVWEIKITNEAGKLVCISRLTLAVLALKMGAAS